MFWLLKAIKKATYKGWFFSGLMKLYLNVDIVPLGFLVLINQGVRRSGEERFRF
jgi:hypothetical protein